jgi:hypothetical protein
LWSSLSGFLCASCTWLSLSLPRFRKFSAITSLNRLLIPLVLLLPLLLSHGFCLSCSRVLRSCVHANLFFSVLLLSIVFLGGVINLSSIWSSLLVVHFLLCFLFGLLSWVLVFNFQHFCFIFFLESQYLCWICHHCGWLCRSGLELSSLLHSAIYLNLLCSHCSFFKVDI